MFPVSARILKRFIARLFGIRLRPEHAVLLALLVMSVAALSCNLFPGNRQPPEEPIPTPTETSESIEDRVASIIADIDADNPDSLYLPETLIDLGRPAVPALLDQLEAPDLISRWAAVYALTRIAEKEDIPRLLVGLQDDNLSNRAGIAATLLWLGDESGIAVLEEALESDELMVFSHPPQRVADYARYVLEAFGRPVPQGGAQTRLVSWNGGALSRSVLPDVSVSARDCTIEVTINLQFIGAGATAALASKWQAAIAGTWDGVRSSFCCETAVTVNTKVGGATDPNYAQITVIQVRPGGYHRSFVRRGPAAGGATSDTTGEWASNMSESAAAHEAGHTMGIPDEYRDNAAGYSEPTAEAANDAVGPGLPSIMAQTWPDSEGDPPEGKARHIDAMLDTFGVSCICCGVVKWDVSAAGFSFTGRIFTCDGKTWNGEFSEAGNMGPVTANAAAEFDLAFEGGNFARTTFIAAGLWKVEDENLPFQDTILLELTLPQGLGNAAMNMVSQGAVISVEGQPVEVPQAIPSTTGEISLPVEPYEGCRAE